MLILRESWRGCSIGFGKLEAKALQWGGLSMFCVKLALNSSMSGILKALVRDAVWLTLELAVLMGPFACFLQKWSLSLFVAHLAGPLGIFRLVLSHRNGFFLSEVAGVSHEGRVVNWSVLLKIRPVVGCIVEIDPSFVSGERAWWGDGVAHVLESSVEWTAGLG